MTFPISSMQPTYFVADTFTKAKAQIVDYCDNITKPFAVTYNATNDTVSVDRKIKTRMENELEEDGPLF